MKSRRGDTILVSGARAPVALAIGSAFAAAGFDVHFVDSVASLMVRWSRFGGDSLHRVRPPVHGFEHFRADIAALVAKLDPVLIVPTCEEVFYLATAAELDGFTHRLFAPTAAILRRLHSKAEFAQVASEAGLDMPQTWRVGSRDGLRAFEARCGELVFKPEYSRFGAEALVRPHSRQLAGIEASPGKPWVVQEFIEGEEVSVWSAARNGRLTAVAGYQPKWQFGGASAYFRRDDDPGLAEACRKLADHTNASGQISLDMIRTADGRLRPIECNPRAVSGVQLFAGDARLALAIMGEAPALAKPGLDACHVGPAFWPAALARALTGRGIARLVRDARASHDVLARHGGLRVPFGAMLDFLRFAIGGARASRSSIQQSTADIEWNGEPIA